MDAQALQALLDSLIECWENEVVEFKRAGNDYSIDATRKDIDQLLSNKLSDALDDAQKETKICRLLTSACDVPSALRMTARARRRSGCLQDKCRINSR